MFTNFNFLPSLRSQTSFLSLCSYHFNQYPSRPQEGVLWISSEGDDQMGGKNQNRKKSLGLQIKPKNAWAKTAKFPSHKNFQKASNNITITNLHIVLNTPKNPYLLKSSCQKKYTCKNPEIKNFNPPS